MRPISLPSTAISKKTLGLSGGSLLAHGGKATLSTDETEGGAPDLDPPMPISYDVIGLGCLLAITTRTEKAFQSARHKKWLLPPVQYTPLE